MASHMSSATPEQIDTLLNFLDEHRDLARGRLRGVKGRRLWGELCNVLNSMGGCTKTVQQWQNVWYNRKHLAMEAVADSRRLASATGGGPSIEQPLSQWDLKILSIMGDGFGERQTGASVPAFPEINEPMPSTSRETESQPLLQPLSLDSPEEVQDEGNNEPTHQTDPSLPVSQQRLSPRDSSKNTRPRRKRSAAGSDVRSRLWELEERREERELIRNAELAGIRAALLQLCGLVEEFLHRI